VSQRAAEAKEDFYREYSNLAEKDNRYKNLLLI
jgi:hypothetical protein